jgi:hypothetical protein
MTRRLYFFRAAMFDHPYEYALELSRKASGVVLGTVPIEPDWVPVREALILDLLRRGDARQPDGLPPITVEPIWGEHTGPPVMIGFRATLPAVGGEASRIFTTAYFSTQARQASRRFVESGVLKDGEAFEYCVLANPRRSTVHKLPRFSLTEREMPLPIKEANFESFMAGALLFGTEYAHDLPVFYHWRVLEQASLLTRKAGSIETGGILVGHACRDATRSELFLEITALIPARAKGELTRLSFTPDTWTDAQAAVDRRNRNEIWLGWFHSHSFYRERANQTESPDSSTRSAATPFLSEEDCQLHRICFPRAYCVALLVTDSQRGLSWSTFGWRSGNLARRAFHVIHAPLPAEFLTQGEKNESNRERALP